MSFLSQYPIGNVSLLWSREDVVAAGNHGKEGRETERLVYPSLRKRDNTNVTRIFHEPVSDMLFDLERYEESSSWTRRNIFQLCEVM